MELGEFFLKVSKAFPSSHGSAVPEFLTTSWQHLGDARAGLHNGGG